jgi:hypothetical protein
MQAVEEQLLATVWRGVTDPAECWIARTGRFFRVGEVAEQPHRAAYRLWVGELTPGMEVSRACGGGACINPDHLVAQRLGTASQHRMNRHGDHTDGTTCLACDAFENAAKPIKPNRRSRVRATKPDPR